MCDYCENEKVIVSNKVTEVKDCFGSKIEYEIEYITFIRGSYICVGDKDDCSCIDHTERKKINNCIMCGEKL